jgi:hypothetical protein
VPEQPSGWAVGWTVFASAMMVLVGMAHLLAGLAAIIEDEFYVLGVNYAWKLDVTAWGWIHLILGVVVIAAAAFLYKGAVWARTVGVLLTMASVIAAFAWLPWYPIWGITIIGMGIAVIWALTAHGRDLAG